jgi:hypothetical protein
LLCTESMLEAIVMCFVLSNLLNVSAFLMWSVCSYENIIVYFGDSENNLVSGGYG